ncbi:MAG: permease [Phycisphaerales bacterium]
MDGFAARWGEAALTTLGFFWTALWAFCLGYVISSMIQVFVTRERMQRTMGERGARSMGLGTFYGFISSSCSFAALSGMRALFQKGAGLAPSLAFLLASTNLVIELGIVIFIFLSWHFVVGEYVGGLLLIGVMWLIVRWTLPRGLVEKARERARSLYGEGDEDEDGGGVDGGGDGEDGQDWKRALRSRRGWERVGERYFMEWGMVWKDVTFGFTLAGVIAVFVPRSFFERLFVGSGEDPAWWAVGLDALIGPLAAFFTFIGSMGNIPLAAVLFGSGVSFAGVMAFIFSDLVVFPMLRIMGGYFGWKMAAYILGVFLVSLVVTAIALHAGFAALGLLPSPESARAGEVSPSERFGIDHTLVLNVLFVGASGAMWWLKRRRGADGDEGGAEGGDGGEESRGDGGDDGKGDGSGGNGAGLMDRALLIMAVGSLVWLGGGVVVWMIA